MLDVAALTSRYGRIVISGTARDVRNNAEIQKIYFGEAQSA